MLSWFESKSGSTSTKGEVKSDLDSNLFILVEESIENRVVFKVRGSGLKKVFVLDSKSGSTCRDQLRNNDMIT
jgi:hypothetical protein